MIFVTVGTQLSFDRLIRSVDCWAKSNPDVKVFAQIGPSKLKTSYIDSTDFIRPAVADDYFRSADLIVAHAGMGSILTALQLKKPILIMPRKASLGEHRNEHQLATAKYFKGKPGIYVAMDEIELMATLDNLPKLVSADAISDFAPEAFARKISDFIHA